MYYSKICCNLERHDIKTSLNGCFFNFIKILARLICIIVENLTIAKYFEEIKSNVINKAYYLSEKLIISNLLIISFFHQNMFESMFN